MSHQYCIKPAFYTSSAVTVNMMRVKTCYSFIPEILILVDKKAHHLQKLHIPAFPDCRNAPATAEPQMGRMVY